MRPLEVLLSLANLLTFLALVVPRLRAVPWVRFCRAGVGAILCSAGGNWRDRAGRWFPPTCSARWCSSGWPLSPETGVDGQSAESGPLVRGWCRNIGRAGVVVGFHRSAPAGSHLPLPHPTGPFGIRTMTYHWVDSARAEVFTADPTDRREVMVQIWYPAPATASGRHASYVVHPQVLAPLAKLFHLPGFVFGYLKYVSTNAISGADAAEGPFLCCSFLTVGVASASTTPRMWRSWSHTATSSRRSIIRMRRAASCSPTDDSRNSTLACSIQAIRDIRHSSTALSRSWPRTPSSPWTGSGTSTGWIRGES